MYKLTTSSDGSKVGTETEDGDHLHPVWCVTVGGDTRVGVQPSHDPSGRSGPPDALYCEPSVDLVVGRVPFLHVVLLATKDFP